MAFIKRNPLTIKQIEAAEEELIHTFPDDYKEFLLKTNGGNISFFGNDDVHEFHVDPIDEEDICISELYGVGKEANNYLIYFNELYEDEINETLIIGDTLSNGFIIYDYLGMIDDESGVYFWDDKIAYECSDPIEGNLYYIAKDFNELLEKSNIKID